jgi:DNA-3-methyladenine glycosylase II
VDSFAGVSAQKIARLQAIAAAAEDGLLDRSLLRSLPIDQALTNLVKLPGIGPFFAQGILFRGAGIVDHVTEDAGTLEAVQRLYDLPVLPTVEQLHDRAQAWNPFAMWVVVLMHIWVRREGGGFARRPRSAS